tara:strand:- start:1536 stop:1766 length:231 start_codon:yes stop_codon:yes gene_type:complete
MTENGKKSASAMALDALDRIAHHEAECGKRWAEATSELKHLSEQVAAHGKRWERLAWLLVASLVAVATAIFSRTLS